MNQFVRDYNVHQTDTFVTENIHDCQTHLDLNKSESDIFSIFHNNIRSISKNFDELQVYLSNFLYCFDCIVLSETWKIENINNFKLNDYEIYYNNGNINKNDGILVYIKKSLHHTVNYINIHVVNVIKINITYDNKKIIITSVYRPPSTNVFEFIKAFKVYLTTLEQSDYNFVIGDLNIDILADKDYVNEYLDTLYESGFTSLINKITRIQGNSKSCLDHIFLKTPNTHHQLSTKASIFCSAITDHYSIMSSIPINKNKKQIKSTVSIKCFEKLDMEKFNCLLETCDWTDFYNCFNPEDASNLLYYNIDTFLKQSTTYIKIKSTKKRKNWITSGLIKSIKTRDKLYMDLKNDTTNQELSEKYRVYKNKLNNLIKKTKREFYSQQINLYKCNTKKLWKTTLDIINKKSHDNNINKITLKNGSTIIDEKEIVDQFNLHYTQIGAQMANDIKKPDVVIRDNISEKNFHLW